jgi:4'-phosphopantetheinyl transferase
LCQLDRPDFEIDALTRTLSQSERSRAARFGTELLRRRWVAGRATLRHLLGESLGLEPQAVTLQRGPRGRPEVQGDFDIDFNISHTEEVALMAIARPIHPPSRIGVDIERASRRVNADRLARKVLTANERSYRAQLAPNEWRQRFLRLWTCKEAMSKATGDALSAPFGRIDVSLEHGPALRAGPPPYRSEDWTLHALDVPAELVATLAVWHS